MKARTVSVLIEENYQNIEFPTKMFSPFYLMTYLTFYVTIGSRGPKWINIASYDSGVLVKFLFCLEL